MGFSTALSGLNAAANLLKVTGNNIANANTTGFKKSRSEFADVYAKTMAGTGSTTPGAGVTVASVSQLFYQGNLETTGNGLDLGVNGEGFFVMGGSTSNINQRIYSRNGAFHVDRDGFVVNHLGQPLLAYPPNGETPADGFRTGVFQALQLDTTAGLPRATTSIGVQLNLDSRTTVPTNAFTGPDGNGIIDPQSYTHATSSTVYDSLGNSHVVTTYFIASDSAGATPNQWEARSFIDGLSGPVELTGSPATLEFDPNGKLSTVNGQTATTASYSVTANQFGPGANDLAFTIDFAGSTQLGAPFNVQSLSQNGLAVGQLTGIDIDDAGIVFARFSNGSSKPLGQVALARFPNPQGLSKLGDTEWAETAESGLAIPGTAGTGSFGAIQSGALESSNVDIAEELVRLIIAQQSYQANAETISTENTITETILNIR